MNKTVNSKSNNLGIMNHLKALISNVSLISENNKIQFYKKSINILQNGEIKHEINKS